MASTRPCRRRSSSRSAPASTGRPPTRSSSPARCRGRSSSIGAQVFEHPGRRAAALRAPPRGQGPAARAGARRRGRRAARAGRAEQGRPRAGGRGRARRPRRVRGRGLPAEREAAASPAGSACSCRVPGHEGGRLPRARRHPGGGRATTRSPGPGEVLLQVRHHRHLRHRCRRVRARPADVPDRDAPPRIGPSRPDGPRPRVRGTGRRRSARA